MLFTAEGNSIQFCSSPWM